MISPAGAGGGLCTSQYDALAGLKGSKSRGLPRGCNARRVWRKSVTGRNGGALRLWEAKRQEAEPPGRGRGAFSTLARAWAREV